MTVPEPLHTTCTSAGLTPTDAQAIIDGTNTHHPAAPALLHAYHATPVPELARPSTPAAYDLGLRLRAARDNTAVDRASSTPVIRHNITSRVTLTRIGTQWTLAGVHEARSITCPGGASDLIRCLATFQTVPALAVAHDRDLHSLLHAVAESPKSEFRDRALGVLHVWRNALEHAGVGYAVNVLDLARARYASAAPDREAKLVHWADLLDLDAPNPHVATLALWDHLHRDMISLGGPTVRESAYHDEWREVWPQHDAQEGEVDMARNLTSREAWAQWLDGYLCEDLVASRAQLWTGRAATGVIRSQRPGHWDVSDVLAFDHRPGSEVALSLDNNRTKHEVTITGVSVATDRTVTVSLTAPGRSRTADAVNATLTNSPSATAATAWITPLAPDLTRVITAGAQAATRREAADAKSWMALPEKKTPTRDVPWDVLFAASA